MGPYRKGRKRVVLAVHRAAAGVGRYGSEESGVRNAEPHFLPFHVAAGMQCARILIHAGEQWIPPGFSPSTPSQLRRKTETSSPPILPSHAAASRSYDRVCR